MGKDLFNPRLHKFSIRKLNVGVCSVLLSTFVLLGATSQVSADETSVTNSLNEVAKTNLDKTTGTSISPTDSKTSEKSETPSVVESSQPTKETATSNSGTEPADKKNNDKSVISETSQSPVEKPVTSLEDKSTESAKPETAVAPIIAEPTETSSVTEQSTRSRRVRRDTQATSVAPASYAGADDATPVPRTSKPELSESEKKESTQLAKQINWIDFSDTASLKNLDPQGGFKIGTTYTKEISPGYVVTLTVTELKPFHATEIYKKRVEGTSSAGTYDPNATNSYLKSWKDYGKTPPPVSGQPQDKWSTIGGQGFDTQGHKTQIIVPVDGVNWGVKFKIEATYRGKKVKPAVVMADGEDANPGEYGIFTTNGEGWEYVGEWMKGPRAKGPYTVTTEELVKQADKTTRGGLLILKDKTVDWNKFLSPDTVTGGLGSQVFGPIVSASKAVPVVMTRGASEVGFYVATAGQQALMMGFLVVDGGDAPESYGEAHHTISTRDSITNVQIKQPYLGSTEADIDVDSKNDWTSDDREDVSDEGPQQLLTADQYNNTNDLLDLNKAKNGTYTLKIKANPNGNAKAYVKAWVDFNNNGKFDDNEGSVVKEITANGDHTLTFNAIPSLSGGLVDQLGMRVRIATNAGDIEKPTGMAFSGEVEDMLVRRTYPPQGEKKETTGLQGETQNATVHFTPKGPDRSDFVTNASMSSQAPQILDNQGNVLTPTNGNTYVRPEGTYVVTTNGDDIDVAFTPNADFTGTAEGINIRRTDSNGSSTNRQSTDASNPNKNDILNNMDGRYIPTVRKIPTYESTGVQGQEQNKNLIFNDGDPDASRPATFVDANGQPIIGNSVPATSNGQSVGTYELDPNTGQVTFKPNKNFVGTPDPVTVQVNDSNGVPYRAHYKPTVTKVTPTSTNATSTGPQGVPQTGTPSFQGGDPLVPIDETVEPTFEDGSKEKSIPGQGTYTIAPDGTVTFTPDKQFVGNPDPVTVKRVDKNGTPVTATYSPEFTKVTPTGTGDKTEGLQGQVQEGKVTFTPGHASVPFPADSTPLFDNGTTVKEVPNVGKFEVDADGKVTFTPDKQFKGETPELELTRVDANGTPVTVKYQAVVKEVTPTGTGATSTGPQGLPQTGTPTFQGGDPLVPIDETVEPTFEDGSKEKSIPGQGTYTIAPDGTVTFTPDKQFVGNPDPVTVKRVDKNGTPVTATYSPEFTKVTPTGTGATSTGPQGLPQTGTPSFQGGDPLVPIDETVEPAFEDGSKEKSIPGQGTYTIAPDGTVTFTPDKQFVGNPAPVTVKRVDKNGTPVTATYSPEFTKVTPTGTGATSTGPQGLPQTGTPTFQGGDPLVPIDEAVEPTFEDGSKEKNIPGQGTYTIAPDGTVTFTPDKQFVGNPDPVTVKRVDKNGTPVTATYSPEFTKVTPTGSGDKTEGLQGQVQEGKVTFTPGHASVPFPADSTPLFDNGTTVKEVPNVGKFEVDADGKVTFTPDKQFKGETPELELTRVDANGTPVTVKYQAVVKEVVPTSTNATSTGPQGVPQTGTPTFQGGDPLVPIDETVEPTFADGSKEKSIPGQGTYTIAPDGTVTFTPDKQFVGKPDPVTVKRVDKNGTPVTATYTPTVTKVTPTGTGATSTGPQGVPQTGTPTFQGGDPLVPIDETVEPTFEDGSKEKSIPSQGTYTIAPDGTVTFTPDKQFVGNPDPVTVKRVDKNGTPVTATYSPEFTKVTPTGTGDKTEGLQGQVQEGKVTFTPGHDSVPFPTDSTPLFDNGTTVKEVPNVGKFEVDADGKVTFTPDKQFKGETPELELTRVDANGTPVTVKYQAVVKEVVPTSTNATSTGPQGVPQTGTPSFQGGDPLVPIDETVEPTFEDGSKEKTIPGQGTYTIAPDGTVTFTPDKQFVGNPTPVTVKRVDKNGTPVTATYSPEFTKVTPTGKDTSSVNIKGLVQTGTPTFEGGNPLVPIDETVAATFEDGTTEKVIPGEGTYAISLDGIVTFTPEANFVGKGTGVTIVRKDKNGTPVTASYRPTVVDPSTGHDTTSTGAKGQPQVATPTFERHIDSTVPPTFEDGSTTMVVPGEGSYTIDKDGKITFTPEPDFVGTAKGLVVKRLDMYGNVVIAHYTPTVLGQTQVSDATSEGLKGQTQTGKPNFTGDVDLTVPPTFEDGTTEKVVPGEGTYVISPDGTVTFTPEADFVGQAKGVKVIRKDRNGNIISGFYTPTVVELPVVENPEQQGITEERTTKTLPNTGSEETSHLTAGLLAALSGMGLISLAQRKKSEEE